MGWIRGGNIPGGVGQSGSQGWDTRRGEQRASYGERSEEKQMETLTSEPCAAAVSGHWERGKDDDGAEQAGRTEWKVGGWTLGVAKTLIRAL